MQALPCLAMHSASRLTRAAIMVLYETLRLRRIHWLHWQMQALPPSNLVTLKLGHPAHTLPTPYMQQKLTGTRPSTNVGRRTIATIPRRCRLRWPMRGCASATTGRFALHAPRPPHINL